MNYRTLGRTGWQISEIGYGMWGMAGWSGADDRGIVAFARPGRRTGLQLLRYGLRLRRGAQRTAAGPDRAPASRQEALHGDQDSAEEPPVALAARRPAGRRFPARLHSRDDPEEPGEPGVDHVDLQQFHVWEDAWAHDERWQRAVEDLKREGLIGAVGISVNRWEPWNVLATLRSGSMDAVQVIYNIFDQAPEDDLFPLCAELQVGRDRPGAAGRRQADRHADTGIALARRRLAQQLLRAGKPRRDRGARRAAQTRSCRRAWPCPKWHCAGSWKTRP